MAQDFHSLCNVLCSIPILRDRETKMPERERAAFRERAPWLLLGAATPPLRQSLSLLEPFTSWPYCCCHSDNPSQARLREENSGVEGDKRPGEPAWQETMVDAYKICVRIRTKPCTTEELCVPERGLRALLRLEYWVRVRLGFRKWRREDQVSRRSRSSRPGSDRVSGRPA